MVCDECRTSADGECGNEHRQSGRRERRRRRVQDEESRRGCGERAGEGDERDDRDRGELLRRVAAASAQSRGRWLVKLGHSALPRLEPVVEVVTPPVDPSDDGPETALVC